MKYTYELCKGRHETPATAAIFDGCVNPTDMDSLYAAANRAIPADTTELSVYVTGLTAAMLAVVSVCANRGITLTAFHFNRDTGNYIPQIVL